MSEAEIRMWCVEQVMRTEGFVGTSDDVTREAEVLAEYIKKGLPE